MNNVKFRNKKTGEVFSVRASQPSPNARRRYVKNPHRQYLTVAEVTRRMLSDGFERVNK